MTEMNAVKVFGLTEKQGDACGDLVSGAWRDATTVTGFLKKAGIKGEECYKGYAAGRLIERNEHQAELKQLSNALEVAIMSESKKKKKK